MTTRQRIPAAAVAVAALGAGVASAGVGHWLWPSASPASRLTSSVTSNSGTSSSIDPALVVINDTFSYQQASGAGTGIVLTSTGEILTNNHVIDGATSITATDLGNGKTYKATVVGYDASDDVAVLQLSGASGLATAPIGNSSSVAVGQAVLAVGNAGGTGTATPASGTVTALDQAITASDDLDGASENLTGLIETNAPIQPGDSGGPLLSSSGRVIGVDTAASEGFAFRSTSTTEAYAIPINKALTIVHQITSGTGGFGIHIGATPFLGVLISSGSGNASWAYSEGATLSGVVAGGAAADAGMVAGDTITSLDGHAVSDPTSLSQIVATEKVGKTVTVTWTDPYGQYHTGELTFQSGPPA